jgi:signal peptidase I
MQVIPGRDAPDERALDPELDAPLPELDTKPLRDGLRKVLDWAVTLGLLLLAWNFLFAAGAPREAQMTPVIAPDQRVLASRITYLLASPKRGEIALIADASGGNSALQRIMGVPGDEIELRGQQVLVNGTAQNDPGILPAAPSGQTQRDQQFVLLAGEYFVAPDNPPFTANPTTLRAAGVIKRDQITGKAWLSFWPPDAIGFVRSDKR